MYGVLVFGHVKSEIAIQLGSFFDPVISVFENANPEIPGFDLSV